mgnify:CR=1 FL=1
MNYNLKNHPNPNDINPSMSVQEWLEGFERELRELLTIYAEGILPITKYDLGRADQIREVLGE